LTTHHVAIEQDFGSPSISSADIRMSIWRGRTDQPSVVVTLHGHESTRVPRDGKITILQFSDAAFRFALF
jgi:hypothetical protein